MRVKSPCAPSDAINAKAKGIPPRFAATPENPVTKLRKRRGRSMRVAASANRNPMSAPSIAEYSDNFSEKINDERFDVLIASTIADVVDPVTGRKALVNNTTVGIARNSPTNRK
jgi:hypothetical protein